MTTRSLCACVVLALTSLTAAQHALDANLGVGAGRVNRARANPALQQDIYTVHRSTGEMRYNRANAFNDPTYTTYQRYTLDRERYFVPGSMQRSQATTSNPRTVNPQSSPQPYHPSRYTPNATPTPGFSKPARRSRADVGSAIAAPQYRPKATRATPAMSTSAYRPTRAR